MRESARPPSAPLPPSAMLGRAFAGLGKEYVFRFRIGDDLGLTT